MGIESAFKFNKEMMEENAESMQKLFEINSKYFSECISLAQTAQEKLVEAKTATGVMEIQKEYSKGVWEATKSNYSANSEIMKDSYKSAGDSMKTAFEQMKEFMPSFGMSDEPVKSKPAKTTTKAASA